MNRKQTEQYITEAYGILPDYPWIKHPSFAVFRHSHSNKWFAVIMDLPGSKFKEPCDTISVINLKCDPDIIGALRLDDGIYPAYHMDKSNWISVALDHRIENEKLQWLIDMSFQLTNKQKKTL